MTWVLGIWCVLILIWAISAGAGNNCSSQKGDQFLSAHSVQQACQAGTGIGIAVILIIGFVGFVFFALIWLMSRPRGRDCPVCGTLVKRGQTVCKGCWHDFAAAHSPSAASAAAG